MQIAMELLKLLLLNNGRTTSAVSGIFDSLGCEHCASVDGVTVVPGVERRRACSIHIFQHCRLNSANEHFIIVAQNAGGSENH